MRKSDPVRLDRYRRAAGDALRAVAPPKSLARALGVSPRYVQMMISGERDGPIAAAAAMIAKLVEAGHSAAPILAYLHSETIGALMRLDDDALRRNLHDLIVAETRAQCALDPLEVDVRMDDADYLARLEQAALEQARRCEEMAATARELRRRIERRDRTRA
ncbi:MAG TPA: hypothetical protein VIL25_09390 [Vicinamibacterales bacterium]